MSDKSRERDGPGQAVEPVQIVSGFRRLVGYHTRVWHEGYAEVDLVIGPQHLNSYGNVHGGVYATLLDVAFGLAAGWVSVPGNVRRSATLSLTTSFVAPARSGRLIATAKQIAIVELVATINGEVRDDKGLLVAMGQGSFRYQKGSEHVEGVPEK